MRPIALTVVGFMYVFSIGFFLAQSLVFDPIGMSITNIDGEVIDPAAFINENNDQFQEVASATMNPENEQGNIFDRISSFASGGFTAVWELLALLSGTYVFMFLNLIGIPSAFIIAIQLIFGLLVAHTVVSFLLNRG